MSRRRRLRAGLAVLGLVALAAAPAGALEVEGVRFAPTLTAGQTSLSLHGAALLRRLLLKGYVAGLYLGPGATPERVLQDVPKRLEIEYFWKISASDFARATDEFIGRNVDEATFATLRPRIDALNALYRSVEPGDRYALTYLPGRGTELALNGEPLGVLPGADFAAAVFSIWLGERPVDRGLKQRLLGAE